LNILLINFASGTPDAGPTYRTHHLAEFWAARGHQVTYVASAYSHLLKEATPVQGACARLNRNGVAYLVLNAPAYRGSGLGRMRNIFTCLWRLRRLEHELSTELKPDVVLAATVYQLDNFSAQRIARACGAAFVRETRDLWPLTLTELGGHSGWHPFVLLVAAAARHAYHHAAAVTTTLRNSLEYMAAQGLARDRWHYLPQCPPSAASATATGPALPSAHRTLLAVAREQGRCIVLFAGSLVPAGDLPTAIAAAAQLDPARFTVVLVGQGPMQDTLRSLIARHGLTHVHLLPMVPKQAVPALLALADIGLLGFHILPLYRHGISPNKLFDYMQAGLPVALYANSPGNPVEASECGIVVPPGNPAALADALRRLAALSREELAAMGRRGQTYLTIHHEFPVMAAEYLSLFQALRLPPSPPA